MPILGVALHPGLIWDLFRVFVSSGPMSCRVVQEFVAFCCCMGLRMYDVGPNFWVGVISFVIAPWVTTAGEFFQRSWLPIVHMFVFVWVAEEGPQ